MNDSCNYGASTCGRGVKKKEEGEMQEEGKQQTTDRVVVQRSDADRLMRRGKGR